MRIFDASGKELFDPDLSLGYLKEGKRMIAYPAVKGVAEQGHYEVIAEYPNGGREVRYVVDVPGVAPQAARQEEEDVLNYIRYTQEELAAIEEERKKPTLQQQIQEIREAMESMRTMLSAMQRKE